MTLTSFSFFSFLLISVILYYTIGKNAQKYVLLGASIFFYFQETAIGPMKAALILSYIVLVTYLGAILINHCKGKLRTLLTALSISSLVAILFLFKYAYNIATLFMTLINSWRDFSWLQFTAVMGISYFVLSAIGYLMDVYWELYPAERNPFTVGLFVLYFPQVISGPITRFSPMREQFNTPHLPDYDNICHGLRRMAWGYFKKLIISERFALVVNTVFADFHTLSGWQVFFATMCYAIQLYTDFSGCMDIVLGASGLFNIRLPENFNAPFLSETFQEVWQRWHITLGGWFKDYVMYPIQISKPFVALGKKSRKLLGKKYGKKIPTYLSIFVLWLLLGVWHGGTAQYFMSSGLIPCVILIGSDLLQPIFSTITTRLKLNTSSFLFRQFRRLRTFLILSLMWVFMYAGSVSRGFEALKHMFTNFFTSGTSSLSLGACSLTLIDAALMIGGLLLLVLEHFCISRHSSIAELFDKQKTPVKIVIIYAELLLLLFFGMVGQSSFIYFNF